MTASNHFLTGAVLATFIDKPLAAIPLAFISHFVIDSLPHFGIREIPRRDEHVRLMKNIWLGDFIMLLVTLFVMSSHSFGWLPYIAGFAAMSPDIAWVYRYVFKEKWGKLPPSTMHWFNEFHSSLQWGEFRRGLIIEIPYYIGMMTLLLSRV